MVGRSGWGIYPSSEVHQCNSLSRVYYILLKYAMQHCVYPSHPCRLYLIAPPASLGATNVQESRVVCDGLNYVTWNLIVYSECSIFKWPWPKWDCGWWSGCVCMCLLHLQDFVSSTFPSGSTVFLSSVMYHWLLNFWFVSELNQESRIYCQMHCPSGPVGFCKSNIGSSDRKMVFTPRAGLGFRSVRCNFSSDLILATITLYTRSERSTAEAWCHY